MRKPRSNDSTSDSFRDYQKINYPIVGWASRPPSLKGRARCPSHPERFWDIFLFGSPLSRAKLTDALEIIAGTGVIRQLDDEDYVISSRLFEEWVAQKSK
jgi:hypothetical protein